MNIIKKISSYLNNLFRKGEKQRMDKKEFDEMLKRLNVWERIVKIEEDLYKKENPPKDKTCTFTKQIQKMQERMDELDKKIQEMQSDKERLKDLEAELENTKRDLENMEEELENIKAQRNEYKERLEESEKQLKEQQEANAQIDQNMQDTKRDLENTEKELGNIRAERNEYKERLEESEKQLKEQQEDINNLQSTLEQKEKEAIENQENWNNQKEQYEKDIAQTESDLQKTHEKLMGKESELQGTQQQLQATTEDFNKTKSEYHKKFGNWGDITKEYRNMMMKMYECSSMTEIMKQYSMVMDKEQADGVDNVLKFIGVIGTETTFAYKIYQQMGNYKKVHREYLSDYEKAFIGAVNQYYRSHIKINGASIEYDVLEIPPEGKFDKAMMQDIATPNGFFKSIKGVYVPGIRKNEKVMEQRAIIDGSKT